jgi:hypothetical protein
VAGRHGTRCQGSLSREEIVDQDTSACIGDGVLQPVAYDFSVAKPRNMGL